MGFWDFADKHAEGLAATIVILVGMLTASWVLRHLVSE